MKHLITVCNQGESNSLNLQFAYEMLGVVIDTLDGQDQAGEARHDLSSAQRQDVVKVFMDNFKDLVYMCLVTLSS